MDVYTGDSQKRKKKFYKSYGELCKKLSSMKYMENNGWEKTMGNDQMYLTKKDPLYYLLTIKVLVVMIYILQYQIMHGIYNI